VNLTQIIFAALASSVGSLMQGMTGLGLNLFASPILVMIEPRLVPGPILAGAILLNILMMARDRSGMDLRGLGWMTGGMLIGTVLAGYLMPLLPQKALSLILGGMVLAGVALSLSGLHFPPWWWVLGMAGLISGIGTTLASIGGPPVALVNQEMEPKRLRATLSGYFFLSGLASLLALIPAGRLGIIELKLTPWVLVGVVIGFFASAFFVKKINVTTSRYILLTLSAISALILIIREI
jgi:uncharacterized membrane protein YfcA